VKLTIYHSDKGDCTLVTSRDGKRLLADGGMGVSFKDTVAAELSKLRRAGKNRKIDVVYVSHIDDDHIGGVLRMLDDAVDWRIYEHKRANGAKVKAPTSPQPPDIGAIWHNGFREQLGENAGPIEDQLAASAGVLSAALSSGSISASLRDAVEEHQDLAASVQQAVQLGRRIRDGELGIPLNPPAKGKLMIVGRPSKRVAIGSMQVRIIGPFPADLEKLREEWDKWLRKSKAILTKINTKAKKNEGELAASAKAFSMSISDDALTAAEALAHHPHVESAQKPLGRRTKITAPNLASLMLFVTEGKRSILLTGDGYAGDAYDGLKKLKLLKQGGLHVDILKVPHHGAADNMTHEFAMAVTADHYVFCGNGFQENPEVDVVQRLFDSRLGAEDLRSTNPEAERAFTFWFNCSAKVKNKAKQKQHMAKIEKLVAGMVKKSKGHLTAKFLGPDDASFDITL
jgi:beta-lactamase superfamily II metal-dependent hydrolase